MSWESRTLAYALRGSSQGDDDLYVMINLGEEAQTFTIQEWERPQGGSGGWLRCVDTWRPSPEDIAGPGQEPPWTRACTWCSPAPWWCYDARRVAGALR